ncbi:hypothetical protein ECHHL_0639 [Ehrlichia chaffeensis str. Heartland]|uniref:Lipoprotein n=1 Tax=Ehrlichia chaffeensis (strain ATCC CRL-10679 / Arkansas) TaxID=205920 RepID=Q2GGA9_EHRCR|nr:hypothetical protein [Ehrlichia chaffeensis]ABD45506.1 putative lipoprotein [Ehrlichia chaffeensis str. Arkansas]AHX03791.1 hypothetical protein ECHHL_0639 [Ehrlichia chaffeensis str. Heartland]AHX05483.1 hypothetical protein ECHJAX_0413 [Ehrlichia chaffeensis str. Jax]AHX06471.1 hypothetical protein ECHLIB_0410 [Ehrlichia chaffeensis str. Liberty]AHX07730.1 hypothetical protein ECHOSC_0652 [Ehrlichia chaffeensis str. Osceola]
MEVSRIVVLICNIAVITASVVGLALSCVNMQHQDLSCVMACMFVFFLLYGLVLLCANYLGVKFDRTVNILYNNTIADCTDQHNKEERSSVLSNLKETFFQTRHRQAYSFSYAIGQSESDSSDIQDQDLSDGEDVQSIQEVLCQGDSDDVEFPMASFNRGVSMYLDSADVNMGMAERFIEKHS